LTQSAYFSLDKPLQKAIVSVLGWRELRPVQEAAIPPLKAGHDAIILAPTAGGKTESALFPLLDQVSRANLAGAPNILYLCPLKALINNLLPRLTLLSRMVGREAFAWHGEVTSHARKAFLKEPKCILLTTPESLQVILSKRDLDPKQIFGHLQSVVIDEVHAFAGEPRGDQLLALLEGLDFWCERPLQRVGLSATVGNPEYLLDWLSGDRSRRKTLVDPSVGAPKSRRKIEVHPVGVEPELCADVLSKLMSSVPKSLLFVGSRRQAEQIRHFLEARGIEALAHHSSLSQELREKSELAFKEDSGNRRRPQAIVCTSTLELGLDVGDIDRVFQLGAPTTVSAFLQRFGRAGRRKDTVGHMVFVTDTEDSFLQSLALIRLAMAKKVENVLPSHRCFPVLVQQILLHILRNGGLAVDKLWAVVGQPGCFRDITLGEKQRVLSHLLEEQWCYRADGRVLLGERTEKRFGRSHFLELLSVFSGTQSVTVKTADGRQVGTIDSSQALELWADKASFILGGGSWKAKSLDHRTDTLTVVPSVGGKTLRWSGQTGALSFELCREMRAILTETEPLVFLGPKGEDALGSLRVSYRYLDPDRAVIWEKGGEASRHLVLETWSGSKINRTLATAFSGWLGVEATSNARRIHLQCDQKRWHDTIQARHGKFDQEFLEAGIEIANKGNLPESTVKFAELLPDSIRLEVEQNEIFEFGPRAVQSSLDLAQALWLDGVPA
jgi:ATP-dependent helicase Lhr and Lhr-like helicase